MTSKTVDSYRFLDAISKRAMKRWASLPGETTIPWTPLARPLSKCAVSLVSSAAIALKTDRPFDSEIERRDPWFADPSYRVLPATARTADVQVCHLHINPGQLAVLGVALRAMETIAEPGGVVHLPFEWPSTEKRA